MYGTQCKIKMQGSIFRKQGKSAITYKVFFFPFFSELYFDLSKFSPWTGITWELVTDGDFQVPPQTLGIRNFAHDSRVWVLKSSPEVSGIQESLKMSAVELGSPLPVSKSYDTEEM